MASNKVWKVLGNRGSGRSDFEPVPLTCEKETPPGGFRGSHCAGCWVLGKGDPGSRLTAAPGRGDGPFAVVRRLRPCPDSSRTSPFPSGLFPRLRKEGALQGPSRPAHLSFQEQPRAPAILHTQPQSPRGLPKAGKGIGAGRAGVKPPVPGATSPTCPGNASFVPEVWISGRKTGPWGAFRN